MIEREWYNLTGAAERIGCTEADVLHLAATERLRLCYLMRAAPADEYSYNAEKRELLNTDRVAHLHGLVGLSAFCAGDLEMRGGTAAQYFLNLLKPGYEWRLTKAAVRADRPEIAIRGNEVEITIRRDDVVIRAVDLKAFETAAPADSKRDRGHVSDRLARLNQAATKFWSNATPEDRSTHPDNADVVQWLMDHAKFSPTLAEKGATIIRPEWAPSGRKPQE